MDVRMWWKTHDWYSTILVVRIICEVFLWCFVTPFFIMFKIDLKKFIHHVHQSTFTQSLIFKFYFKPHHRLLILKTKKKIQSNILKWKWNQLYMTVYHIHNQQTHSLQQQIVNYYVTHFPNDERHKKMLLSLHFNVKKK